MGVAVKRTGLIVLTAAVTVGLGVGLGAQVGFRSGTDLVLLTVSAVTGQGRAVPGLRQDDFHVAENGVPQEVSFFAAERLPVSLSILIDASSSMDIKIGVAREAASGFCRRLNAKDVAQIIAFSSDIQIRQPFTSNVAALEKAIAETRPGGSTSLYTAIYVALNELKKVRRTQNPDEIRRQAIVVLSDGEDTTSLLKYDEVLDLSKREDVAVYAIGLRGGRVQGSREFNESEYVLRTLAQTTGGRAFFVSEMSELSTIYNQIADELASQYTLGYVSKNTARDGKWRQVSVRVSQPGVLARTRTGYFAPSKER
jgi:VWFA-related protein